MKTSELIGSVLNHAVHLALGLGYRRDEKYGPMYFRPSQAPGVIAWDNSPPPYSTDWSQGGPIIEREKISVWLAMDDIFKKDTWAASYSYMDGDLVCEPEQEYWGHTPLIAAMRCYVASKLGDEVDVPKDAA